MIFDRRTFVKVVTLGGLLTKFFPGLMKSSYAKVMDDDKPATNIKDALAYPRTPDSMPGKFPGKVVELFDEKSVTENTPVEASADNMLHEGMLRLTGKTDINDAWLTFVSPDEKIGLKLNPVAGENLSTSRAVVNAVIKQLEAAGIPRKNLVIWDRREFQLHETGFTEKNYPGITITGTERQDSEGSFFNAEGKLYSEDMIDKDWYYWADVEGTYDEETLPYMVNEGKYSYFSKICTQQVDKIINLPILKNAGPTVTLCLKNLAYGTISNTGRLHAPLWSETCAEVCAFPPLRDKVVLNIVDGLIGCYSGGPGYNPQFITNYKTMLIGSDPVAVDRVGYDIVLKKRLEEGVQKKESDRGKVFMELAADLKLGIADMDKIERVKIDLS